MSKNFQSILDLFQPTVTTLYEKSKWCRAPGRQASSSRWTKEILSLPTISLLVPQFHDNFYPALHVPIPVQCPVSFPF